MLSLAALGRLAAEPAAAAVFSLAAISALVWLAGVPAARVASARKTDEVSAASVGLPAETLMEIAEGLPDPVLVIGGFERDDYAGRRILFANLAARDLFRVPSEAMLLTAVLQPGGAGAGTTRPCSPASWRPDGL